MAETPSKAVGANLSSSIADNLRATYKGQKAKDEVVQYEVNDIALMDWVDDHKTMIAPPPSV